MSGKSRSNRRRGDRFKAEYMPDRHRQAKPPARCPADGCGKIPYPSKVTASKARADLRRTLGLEPGELETYRCRSGNGWWHVAHVETRSMRGEQYKPPPKNQRISHREVES